MTAPASPFTGRHMAAILVAGFGVVIAVNFTMAHLATSTFGGEVVENSYVASQHFNGWLGEAAREKALGWSLVTERRGDGHVLVVLRGVPAGARVRALARHPLGRLPDTLLTFRGDGEGRFLSPEVLPAGRWMLRFEVEAAGHYWRVEEPVA